MTKKSCEREKKDTCLILSCFNPCLYFTIKKINKIYTAPDDSGTKTQQSNDLQLTELKLNRDNLQSKV